MKQNFKSHIMNHKHTITSLLFLLFPLFSWAQPNISIEPIYDNFNQPLALTHAGDERIFIVQKEGKIICINTKTEERYTFLDIENLVSTNANERGLLGLAFDPDFKNNGYFFINYTNNQGNTVIARLGLQVDNPLLASPASLLQIITIDQPYSNHNGGCIAFGKDNYLYIGNGDGGSAGDPQNASQNPQSMLGKMLRLDVSEATQAIPYQIPTDNPFINDPAVLDEIWAFGLRNPWRFSFDRNTGDLWIGDVGQNIWEEVDYVPFEAFDTAPNFGWRCYEGFEPYNTNNCSTPNAYDEPVVVYNNDDDGCSITGGHVYRGCSYPALYGYYIYMDYCSGRIWGIDADGSDLGNDVLLGNLSNFNFASFGEDSAGEMYLLGIANGTIYKVVESSALISYSLDKTDVSCDGELGSLSFNSTEDANYWSEIQWNNDASASLLLSDLEIGVYTLTLNGSNGCMLSLSEEINAPSILDSPLVLSMNIDGDSLTVNSDFDNYQWLIAGEIQTETGPEIRISASGVYQVNVWNDDRPDCVLSQDMDIISSVTFIDGDQINILPNPVQDKLIIQGFDFGANYKLGCTVYDLKGRKILDKTIETNIPLHLNVSGLKQGSYILEIKDFYTGESYIKKFLK